MLSGDNLLTGCEPTEHVVVVRLEEVTQLLHHLSNDSAAKRTGWYRVMS